MSQFFSGIALPWGPTIPSVIEPKDDKDVLKSSVLWIVLTGLRERVMLPEFGSELPGSLFEPNDAVAANKIKRSVCDAIARWDDRIEFVDFVCSSDNNTLKCTLSYKQKADPTHDSYQVVAFEVTPDMVGQ